MKFLEAGNGTLTTGCAALYKQVRRLLYTWSKNLACRHIRTTYSLARWFVPGAMLGWSSSRKDACFSQIRATCGLVACRERST